MNKLLGTCLLVLSFSTVAFADITVDKNTNKYGPVTMTITGSDAAVLSDLIKDDSILAEQINSRDASAIRSLSCNGDSCTLLFEGELKSNKDTEDYYDKSFNKTLLGLKDDQRIVTGTMGRGFDGVSSDYEARITRLLLEQSQINKNIKIKRYSLSKIGKGPEGTIRLFDISLKISSLEISCYSTLYTDMGNVNKVFENCSLTATATVK